jgi:hypothetical protein
MGRSKIAARKSLQLKQKRQAPVNAGNQRLYVNMPLTTALAISRFAQQIASRPKPKNLVPNNLERQANIDTGPMVHIRGRSLITEDIAGRIDIERSYILPLGITAMYAVANLKPPLHTLCPIHRNSLVNQGTLCRSRLAPCRYLQSQLALDLLRSRPPDPVAVVRHPFSSVGPNFPRG